MTCLKKVSLTILLVILTIVTANEIMADEFKLIPSLTVRGEYNDNIFYGINDTVDDYITTISAGLNLIERTERLDLGLSARVSPFYYADLSDLDEVDQNYQGKGSYQISQLFRINANALFDVSNRRDRDIETTGVVLTNDERKRQKYGLGFDLTLTEKAAIGLSFGYLQDTWDVESLDRQDLEDYRAGLNFTYNLSKWWDSTTSKLSFEVRRYRYDLLDIETSETYNYSGTIGVQHWFSETVNLTVDFGTRYTDSDYLSSQPVLVAPSTFEVRSVELNNTSFGGTGQAILEIKGEVTRGSIRIAHGVSSASGRGTTVQRSDVVLSLRRRLTERSAIAIVTGYHKNKAPGDEFSAREIDEDSFFVRPRIRWEFFENFTLDAGYNFNYIDDRVDNNDRRRNLVYLQVAYGLPLFE